jgi:hypothetical protein
MSNAILPEVARTSRLADPYLLWFWNSNVRSTAIVLNSLVRADAQARLNHADRSVDDGRAQGGRWGNTQENAYAMGSLVNYYRKYETVVPDFSAVVTLGDGRSRSTGIQEVGRLEVSGFLDAAGAVGDTRGDPALTFSRAGTGTLFIPPGFVTLGRGDSARARQRVPRGTEIRTVCREWSGRRPPQRG